VKQATRESKWDTWTFAIPEFVQLLGLPDGTSPLTVHVSYTDREIVITARAKEAQ
jgi:hypothetical protein